MEDDPFEATDQPGVLARLTRDPVRLRQRARWAALALGVVAALAADGLGGWLPGLLYPLCWLAAVPLAIAVGFGDAFFLSHDRGQRRVLLTLLAATLALLAGCVILSTALASAEDGAGRVLSAALYGVLLLAALFALAALVALGLSRGTDYAGRRISQLDDEGW